MKHVKKAKQLLKSKSDRMTAADWRIVGLALMEGREAHPSNKAFSNWLKSEGLSLPKDQIAEALWLADDKHWTFYQGESGWRVKEARKAWNSLHVQLRSETRQLLMDALLPKEQSTQQIAELCGLDVHRTSRTLADLKKTGKVFSDTRGHYRLPTKAEAKAPVEKRSGNNDTFSFGHLARITNGLRQALTFRRAGWDHIPSSHDPVTADGMGRGLAVLTPDNETWSAAITKKARKGTTLTMSHGKTHEVEGYAEGYLVRVVIDRVRVPVNTRGESLGEHMEVLKQ